VYSTSKKSLALNIACQNPSYTLRDCPALTYPKGKKKKKYHLNHQIVIQNRLINSNNNLYLAMNLIWKKQQVLCNFYLKIHVTHATIGSFESNR